MIYTVGHTVSYKRAFNTPPVIKIGRRSNYPGGSVWKTYEEAAQHRRLDQSVWGVKADWDTDTEPNRLGHPWHDLLVDAEVVDLEAD